MLVHRQLEHIEPEPLDLGGGGKSLADVRATRQHRIDEAVARVGLDVVEQEELHGVNASEACWPAQDLETSWSSVLRLGRAATAIVMMAS